MALVGLFDLFKRKKAAPEAASIPPAHDAEPEAAPVHVALSPPSPFEDGAAPLDGPSPNGAASSSPPKTGSRLQQALNRTRAFLATAFSTDNSGIADEAYYADMLDGLVMADTGMEVAEGLISEIKAEMARRGKVNRRDVPAAARAVIADLFGSAQSPVPLDPAKPSVIVMVGVNGSGKTTLSAKLAYRLKQEGRSVLLAAADTFRAAATEQLKIWAGRAGVDIVAGQEGADPASVVFDAVQAAQSRGIEVLIVDTAGRLQTKGNLMAELQKIVRTVDKAYGAEAGGIPANIAHLLVLDATVGQNALSQAELFDQCCSLTGIAMNKLDGSAKGGALLAVASRLKVPVLYVGLGEGIEDLVDFDANEFAAGIWPE
jgi:fused signal recognition particle receptor